MFLEIRSDDWVSGLAGNGPDLGLQVSRGSLVTWKEMDLGVVGSSAGFAVGPRSDSGCSLLVYSRTRGWI